MSKRGWRVIKTLSADEARVIRASELDGAAQAHAEIGESGWAEHYAARAAELKSRR